VAEKPKKKRKMSATGRKAISDATKKRWAAARRRRRLSSLGEEEQIEKSLSPKAKAPEEEAIVGARSRAHRP
jgi:hypothetical protein